MRFVALAAWLGCSCTVVQARKAHTAGEVTLAGGLIGILATIAASELVPSHSADLLRGGVVFVPISVAGALIYAATDGLVNATEPTATARARGTAWELAKEAKHAARRNDCAEVQAIQPRVRELDVEIYRRFLNDEIIRGCLAPPEPSESPAR
jgi:hypothetical protein